MAEHATVHAALERAARSSVATVRSTLQNGVSVHRFGESVTFETLRAKLGIIGFSLDIREGRGIRGLIERVRGPSAAGKKRPNVYRWCYADDRVCVAQGTSGSVAVWAAE